MSAKTANSDYLSQCIALALAKNLPPGVHHVVVLHDRDCPILNGGDECRCEPEVTICEGEA